MLGATDPWVRWDWVQRHGDDIRAAVVDHAVLTAIAVGIGLVVAVPVGVASVRWRRVATPSLAVAGIVYTIPSLALFALLIPWTGLTRTTAEIGLVSYTLLILLRNTMAGLSSVPPEVLDAADGMGFGPMRRLVRIELPLALPVVIAGIRIATVTTIGLVTVTALIGQGGLGQFILEGLIRDFRTPLVVGCVLSVVLAAVADIVLLGAERAAGRWRRAGG